MNGGTVLAVTDENGTIQHWNLYGNELLGRQKSNGDRRFYVYDHLGSTRQVVDENDAIMASYDYYPFGMVMRASLTELTKETFTGKELDEETGLYYFGARYYDAALGRWSVMDPAGQFATPYGYANNPVSYVDPDGAFVIETAMITAFLFARSGSVNSASTGEDPNTAVLKGAISGALIGGLFGPTGGITAGQALWTVGSSMLPLDVPIYQGDNFSLSLSPSFFSGTDGFGIGASLNASGSIEGFQYGFSSQLMKNSNTSDLSGLWNNDGWVPQYSGMVGYSEKGWSVSAGATHFGGSYGQTVGIIGGSVGRFSFYSENDVGVNLGDGRDRYRTAALYASYQYDENTSISGGFQIRTGMPLEENKGQEFYENEDAKIRNGVLFGGITTNGRTYQAGWNSEAIRAGIQNNWHSMPFINSPHFVKQPYQGRAYSRYRHGKYHTIY